MSFFSIGNESGDYIADAKEKQKRGAKNKYPFANLDLHQSFTFGDDVKVHSMRCMASRKGKEFNKVFFVDVENKKVVRLA